MKNYLCLECGTINYENDTDICISCEAQLNSEEYNRFKEYANRAIIYGYNYRVEYEKQVDEYAEVRVKYSLADPSIYLEWLGLAALSGVVGSVAYDLTKIVAKQILSKFKRENVDNDKEYSKLESLLNDPEALILFTNYIHQYYKGHKKLNKKVEEGILEEEITHSLIDNHKDKFKEKVVEAEGEKEEILKQFSGLFLEAAKEAAKKRNDKPTLKELQNSMKLLKKEIKKERKRKKDKKAKKKKKGKRK